MEHGTASQHQGPSRERLQQARAGEIYKPIVAAATRGPRSRPGRSASAWSWWSLFSAACIYMALRAGNAIEAAIPIAILAIFFGKMRKTRAPSSRT